MNPFACLSFGQIVRLIFTIHPVVMNQTFLTEQTIGCLQVRAELGLDLYDTSPANTDWPRLPFLQC
jgi:hypothetical protein